MTLDGRRLHYFVTVAEAGSLGRAAALLHVAQPALTRQIRLLEEDVGVALMRRTSRGMVLTPAGQVYCDSARKLLADARHAASTAVLAARGDLGHLRLGFSEIYAWHPQVLDALQHYRQQSPGVTFTIEAMLSGAVTQRLLGGQLDLAVVYAGTLLDDGSLQSRLWITDEYRLAVNANSALARKPPKHLRELADEDFIFFRRDESPQMHDMIIHHFHQRGYSPRIVQEGTSHHTAMTLVAAGLGCSVLPLAAQVSMPANIRLVAVADMQLYTPIHLVWRRDNPSPLIGRFAQHLLG
jgi:DNA-binding transcriptional LysR family regulator